MTGAILVAAIEFAAPGVPPAAVLAPQFCPLELSNSALINSRERPSPSAADCQPQPRCPKSAGLSRCRSAQSPSSAYATWFRFVPRASTSVILLLEFDSCPIQPTLGM